MTDQHLFMNSMLVNSQPQAANQPYPADRSLSCKPWGSDRESLLGIASSVLGDGYQFNIANMSLQSLFPDARSGRPADIASRVLAELSDDSLFDPPTDDIFDEEPAAPSEGGNLRHVLKDTLNQVLSLDVEFPEDQHLVPSATSVPASQVQTKRSATMPTCTVPSAKRQRTSTAPSPFSQNTNESEDDASKRFRPYQAEQWNEKFDELTAFRKEKGHCCVPHTFEENPSLARWVKRQRYQYKLKNEGKASTITDERIMALEKVGFVWDSHGASWMERWNELSDFAKEYGHANVPSNHTQNPQLATWVKCQRRQYKLFWEGKPSNMSLDRITKLEKIGFEWELRASHKKSPTKEQLSNDILSPWQF